MLKPYHVVISSKDSLGWFIFSLQIKVLPSFRIMLSIRLPTSIFRVVWTKNWQNLHSAQFRDDIVS